jgi:hypothetical protein
MSLPNFFIAGAPKAGTDLLFYQLARHPQIYMSPLKEPNYFADEIRPHNFHVSLRPLIEEDLVRLRAYVDAGAPTNRFGGIISDLGEYQRLFANARSQPAIGEGSVCYLWSKSAATKIARTIPHARIILVLMDPAERAFHQYLKSLSDKTVSHSFSKHLELAFRDRSGPESEIRHYNPFLAFGQYSEQVSRYLQSFPRSQLFISLYEDTQADYDRWFGGVLSFLQVDTSFGPPDVEVPSKPHLPECCPMPAHLSEDRARLVDYYRADILRLQQLIGRDLSAWLR